MKPLNLNNVNQQKHYVVDQNTIISSSKLTSDDYNNLAEQLSSKIESLVTERSNIGQILKQLNTQISKLESEQATKDESDRLDKLLEKVQNTTKTELFSPKFVEAVKKKITPLLDVAVTVDNPESKVRFNVMHEIVNQEFNSFYNNSINNQLNDGDDELANQIAAFKGRLPIQLLAAMVFVCLSDVVSDSVKNTAAQASANQGQTKDLNKILAALQDFQNSIPFTYKDQSGKSVTVTDLYTLYQYATGEQANPQKGSTIAQDMGPLIDLLKKLPGGNDLSSSAKFNAVMSDLFDKANDDLNHIGSPGITPFGNDSGAGYQVDSNHLNTITSNIQNGVVAGGNFAQQLSLKLKTEEGSYETAIQEANSFIDDYKSLSQSINR